MSSSDDELVAFWAARLDEAEAAAWAIHDVSKCDALLYEEDLPTAAACTPDCDCGYPARALREVGADRDLLAALEQAREYSDRVFGPAPPGNIASGEWLSERMRAATQVLVLEQVAKIRAAVYSDHPDYQERWKP